MILVFLDDHDILSETVDDRTGQIVDANIQREELLPSELAFAFKMKMDAMRHQGTSGHDVRKLSQDTVGENSGMSGRQVTRYIRLTELIPELLEMVDSKRITFISGVEISYIDKTIQKWLYEYIHDNGVIKPEQIAALRKRLESDTINQSQMVSVLNESLKGKFPSVKVNLNEKKLRKYFPPSYSSSDMESVILALLEEWKQSQGGS